MCIGIDHCSKKACLENERCVVNAEPKFKTPCEVRRGPRKKNHSLKVKIPGPEILGSVDLPGVKGCTKHNKLCSNERACEILGQCLLQHPLIRKDSRAFKRLYSKTKFNEIVKIAERLMPSLNKPKNKNASRNKSNK